MMKFHRAVDCSRAVAWHTPTARAVDCARAVDSSPTSLPPPFAASRRLLKKSKENQLLEQLGTRYPTARAVNNRRLKQSTLTARAVRVCRSAANCSRRNSGNQSRHLDVRVKYCPKRFRGCYG
ncbi:hypothetical protein SFRURICE_015271 [Spodoptera frugiperda]|nr:hypothetical protein SFRURICE_015271 [Spodoptera frugiperda]